MTNNKGLLLFCDSSSGQYIPQRFANEIQREYLKGVSVSDLTLLADPANELYWEVWDHVLNNAEVIYNGYTYTLYHDGDLWLVCDELLTDDERLNFYGEA